MKNKYIKIALLAMGLITLLASNTVSASEATRKVAWEEQLSKVAASLVIAKAKLKTAQLSIDRAISGVANNWESVDFPAVLFDINSSKQANLAFITENNKLTPLSGSTSDNAVIDSYTNEHSTLVTATNQLVTRYEALYSQAEDKRLAAEAEARRLAAEAEARRLAAEAEARRLANIAWQNQLSIVTTSLATATTKLGEATTIMEGNSELSTKSESIEVSKQANALALIEIRKLEVLKRTDADIPIISSFIQEYQTLNTGTNTLVTNYEVAITEVETDLRNQATLTGNWKFPTIKGLTYKTTTHSGVTDEHGAYKCQPGETVTFLIKHLILTSIYCIPISNIKTTKNIALSVRSDNNFKNWQNETGKQVIITKILFGLFGESIKSAFNQSDASLKLVDINLTEAQESNTSGQTLDIDIEQLVQNISGITENITLPTDTQTNYMITKGWFLSQVFPNTTNINIVSQIRSIDEKSPVNAHVGNALNTTGLIETFAIIAGNSDGFFKINNTGQIQVAKIGLDYETKSSYVLTVKITSADTQDKTAQITININDILEDVPVRPVIEKFTVTQGITRTNPNGVDILARQGRVISKKGLSVTVRAVITAGSYEWSSPDFTALNGNDKATFVFNPEIEAGNKTIKLKITNGGRSSERVLELTLIEELVSSSDSDGDGIADDKDTNTENNKIQVGEGKAIISPTGTRILLGAMGKDSGRLTLDQMKAYTTANGSTDNTIDTLATGDIYDYVVEGLSAGDSVRVVIELITPIPENAVLRRYSMVNGWGSFVNSNNAIQSKASCTDNTWQPNLITGATCLKLTIKDGSENDTDGIQANNTGDTNGVVASTISIAVPTLSSDSSDSSGGGCVYNPNAPARFDMGFILLMVLSAYYLIRRKRQFVQ
jgi:hypothetical protein